MAKYLAAAGRGTLWVGHEHRPRSQLYKVRSKHTMNHIPSSSRRLQRVRVSDNHRFLVTDDGAPFFWLGDTAWELFHRLTREEAAAYFANRQRNRFNVVQAVALAEFDGLGTPNAYGELPLI